MLIIYDQGNLRLIHLLMIHSFKLIFNVWMKLAQVSSCGINLNFLLSNNKWSHMDQDEGDHPHLMMPIRDT